MVQAILWDVDGTLLDFDAAESAAIRSLAQEVGFVGCDDAAVNRYREINHALWKRLERGICTREQVLIGRFQTFFAEMGWDPSRAEAFNRAYQPRLGETIVYRDDSLAVVKALKTRVKQYVVSNGTVAAQTKKLERSGLGALMDGVFLSERLGVEKPNPAFFEQVFAAIGPIDRSRVLLVGDSLTSDMQGGNAAGVRTAWYNPDRLPLPDSPRIDYDLANLNEVFSIL